MNMSVQNVGCNFCDSKELNAEGSILIQKTDAAEKYWLELFHQDNRTITAYLTVKEGWDPIAQLDIRMNYCPMCGRKLYSKNDEKEKRWEKYVSIRSEDNNRG